MTSTDTAAPTTLDELLDTVTQREWLQITRALEARKDDVQEDSALFMPMLCYVWRLRNGHAAASWDSILELTDPQLVDEIEHLLPEDKRRDSGKAPETPGGGPSESTPETSTASGDSIEPVSASPLESSRPPMTT